MEKTRVKKRGRKQEIRFKREGKMKEKRKN
jgi:hypothetical protein